MLHFVHDGSSALIGGVGSHVHPGLCLIVAVGGGGARTVGDVECLDHAGHVVEVVASGIHRIGDALLRGSITLVMEVPGDVSLRNGVELDDVTIDSLAALGLHVGTHIILGGRRELLQPIDAAAIVQEGLCRLVVDGGLGFLGAVAEALLFNLRGGYPANGHSAKSHRRSASKALVGGHCLCPCSGADCHEHQHHK